MKPYKHLCHALMLATALLPVCTQGQLVRSSSGLNLVATGDLKLVFNDAGLANNGSFAAGKSTVVFTSDGANLPVSIGGSHPVSFYHIVISQPADVTLNNNIGVDGNITLNQGNLLLNNHLLDLGRTGTIVGERNESRITDNTGGGRIRATATLYAPSDANPGNIGVSISSPASLGETVITRGHIQQPGFSAKPAIHRYYDVSPAINSNLKATVKFHYLDAELGSNNESELGIFSRSGLAGNWQARGKDNQDAGTNWVVKTQLDQLHSFTLARSIGRIAGAPAAIQVYPNPTAARFTVSVYSPEEKDGGIVLYDALGRILERKKLRFEAGQNTISWNLSKYASGTYHLMFENIEADKVKVVKQ